MRLDKTLTKPVQFEDVTFHVTRMAKPQYDFIEAVSTLGDKPNTIDAVRVEDEYVANLVVRIENLYDGKGDPITELPDAKAVSECLPLGAKQAIITGYQEGGSGNADSSGDKPGDGSQDSQ